MASVTTDLIIRAAEIKTKPLEDLLGLLTKLTGALDSLSAEGGPATRHISELRDEAEKFKILQGEIAGRRSLLESFGFSQQGVAQAREALAVAKTALATFTESLPAARQRTAAQKEELAALTKGARASATALSQAEKRLASSTAALQRMQVDTSKAAEELAALRAAQDRVNAGFDRATLNVQGYQGALRQKKAAEAEAHAAAQAAQKAEEGRAAAARTAAEAEIKLIREREVQRAQEQVAAAEGARRAANAARALQEAQGIAVPSAAAPAPATAASRINPPAQLESLSQTSAALAEIEQRQKAASSAWGAGRDVLAKAGEDYQRLAQAIRNADQQAGVIDGLRAGRAELQRAEEALQGARDKAAALQAALQAGGVSTEQAEAGTKTFRAEIERLAGAVARGREGLAQLEARAKALGIDTRDLAQAEETLVSNTERARRAMAAATDDTTQLGQATRRAAAETGAWGDSQRTALSWGQRLRGQILSMTAAYVGLFGAISEGRAALDATTANAAINNRLSVAVGGDPKQLAFELSRVRQEADHLGLSIQSAADSYSRFALAARAGGMSADESFRIFQQFSQVARVYKLTEEESKRMFKALEQMMSKGKIASEELRQQLGDVLPGAVPAMAKALGMIKPGELDKALEQGRISSKNLILFAQEMAGPVQGQLATASKSWQAELQRLTTALFDFRNKVADSGFGEAMGQLAKRLSGALGGEQGDKLAKGIGTAFTSVTLVVDSAAQVLRGFVDTGARVVRAIDSLSEAASRWTGASGTGAASAQAFSDALYRLGEVLGVLAGLWAINKVVMWVEAISAGTKALALFTGAATVAGAAVQRALLPVFVAITAFELGSWLNENVKLVQLFGVQLVGAFMMITKGLAGVLTGRGLEGFREEYAKMLDAGRAVAGEARAASRGPVVSELESRRRLRAADQGLNSAPAPVNMAPVLLPGKPDHTQEHLLKDVMNQVQNLETRAAKRTADSAAEQMSAIDKEYEKLFAKIMQIGKVEGANGRQELWIRAEIAKEVLKEKVAAEWKAKRAWEEYRAAVAAREAAMALAKTEAENDPEQKLHVQEAITRASLAHRDAVLASAAAALKLAEAEKNVVEVARLRAEISNTRAKGNDDREISKARLADLQSEVRQLIAVRDAQVAAATAAADRLDPTGETAIDRTAAIMEKARPAIEAAATSARDLAEGLGEWQDKAGLDELLVKLDAVDVRMAKIREQVSSGLVSGFTDLGVSISDAFAGWMTGADSFSAALGNMRGALKNFARSFLQMVQQMIARAWALRIVQAMTGMAAPAPAAPAAAVSAEGGFGVFGFHGGGVVGAGSSNWGRQNVGALFAGAPRYHTGAVVGLRPDEQAAILQHGEEVLSKDNPRNILNGGGRAPAATPAPQSIRIANLLDPRQVVAEGLDERTFINMVVANKASIKRVLA